MIRMENIRKKLFNEKSVKIIQFLELFMFIIKYGVEEYDHALIFLGMFIMHEVIEMSLMLRKSLKKEND
jgi:hypothetical protein